MLYNSFPGMGTDENITEMQTDDVPVAQHVTLVPEGISSVRDIPGLTRATQGERAILQQVQKAIDQYAGKPVDEFWMNLWRTLARSLRMETVYLVQVLWDLSSEDFLWTRILFSADCTPQQPSAPIPLRSGIYATALHRKKSEGLSLERPTRLDTKLGAYSKIPRSVESQVQNEGLTCFYLSEVHELAEKRSSIVSTAGDGTNHFQMLPIVADAVGNHSFYLGFDHHGVSESIAAFDEMIEFIHERLNEALNDLIRILMNMGEERSFPPQLTAEFNRSLAPQCSIVHKSATSDHFPILSRDLMLTAAPTWPWHRRVAGLFTVEGATGSMLNKATEDVYRILEADFKKLCSADDTRVQNQFWNWHLKMYLLARELNLPLRVSGCLLSVRAGEWYLHSVGTAMPVLHLSTNPDQPVRFEIPNKNLYFLGYNPISASGTGELANGHLGIPTERMKPSFFAPCSRYLGVFKRDIMVMLSSGWLEQCHPEHGPAYYETRYTIQGLMTSLHNVWGQGGVGYEQLAQRLANEANHYAAVVQDASLLVLQG